MKVRFSMDRGRETFFAIMIIIGSISFNETATIIYYMMALLLQINAFINIISKKSTNKGFLNKYLFTILIITGIALIFFTINTPFIRVVNRIMPLIAIFGCFIIVDSRNNFDIEFMLYRFVNLYTLYSIVINLDALRFIITGNSWWKPITYLGYRFIGPIGDANYLSLFSSAVLLIVLFGDKRTIWKKKISTISLVVNIIFAGSMTSFILIPAVILIHIFIKQRNLFIKSAIIFSAYIIVMLLFSRFGDEIRDAGINLLNIAYRNTYAATVKWESLQIRLDVQLKALSTFIKEPWGQGPRQLVEQLGHDTHNSFVSIMFEEGLFGILLIFVTLKTDKAKNGLVDIMGTYLLLSALLLDVHFTSIYLLLLVMQYYDNSYNIKVFRKKIMTKEYCP